ncbi:hypothetical protein P3T76_008402 [Phytophthora citrophthora]|uniref:Uncharacterized protein n=1 Tax=Phytophthora citrophthora TaxID=4793 RepID=A0AAD9GJZ3_9STRA|nr:hypothetical protein P3T76_008402 [Phytophthora citrophthora]
MSGKLHLPPDKRMYEDDIVPETPPPQSPPPKRVKCQDVKDRIARNKTLDFFVMMKTLRAFSKPKVPRSQSAALPAQARRMRGISRPRRKRGQEQHVLPSISEWPLRLRH